MKKALTILILLLIPIFCSCTNKEKETFFVHAIGFEGSDDGVKITAVLENLSKNKKDFFTAESSGSSINKAAEKLSEKYRDCYFATCDLYFLDFNAKSSTVETIAKDICDSNIFPTTNTILCIKDTSLKGFLDEIKSGEDTKQIKEKVSKNKVNTAAFFAHFYSGKSTSLDTLAYVEDSFEKVGKTKFSKGRKAVFNEK